MKATTTIVKYESYEIRSRVHYVTDETRINFRGPLRETATSSFNLLRRQFLTCQRLFSTKYPNERDRLTSLGNTMRADLRIFTPFLKNGPIFARGGHFFTKTRSFLSSTQLTDKPSHVMPE